MNNDKDIKYPISVSSDKEFWGIVYAMPSGSYTCLTNLTEGYTKALYIDKSK